MIHHRTPFRSTMLALTLIATGLGCASVELQKEYSGALPRPEQIIVFDFAVTPEDVQVDTGLAAKAARSVEGKDKDEERDKVAREVAREVAKKLVQEISAMGLPAVHATDPPIAGSTTHLLVRGTFVAVDEGDQTERVAIGFGAGKSKVVIEIELVDWVEVGERVVERLKVTAKSGYNPGMAETMGAGALAGHLLVSAAVSTGAQSASEYFGSSIDADSERAAKNAAKMMKKFFVREGWIEE